MKNKFKVFAVITMVAMIGLSMIACDFFKEKDCSHCGGTGNSCWDPSCLCWDRSDAKCYVCSGTGKVPDW